MADPATVGSSPSQNPGGANSETTSKPGYKAYPLPGTYARAEAPDDFPARGALGWTRLRKLLLDLEAQEATEDELEHQRQARIIHLLGDSRFFGDDPTKFDTGMLNRLFPNDMEKELKKSYEEYGKSTMKDFNGCITLGQNFEKSENSFASLRPYPLIMLF
jgi:hypothetical protein